MRILLIDDDPDIRLLAGFVLEQAGHQLTCAESGAAGIAAAATDAFDVVLLDFRLGDMTGDDVLPRLLEQWPERPVVFLTGTEDPAVARAFVDAGAAAVIAKPFDPESLASSVERVVRSGQGR